MPAQVALACRQIDVDRGHCVDTLQAQPVDNQIDVGQQVLAPQGGRRRSDVDHASLGARMAAAKPIVGTVDEEIARECAMSTKEESSSAKPLSFFSCSAT